MRSSGGFYDVDTPAGVKPYRACGRFRIEGVKPLVGDLVEVEEGSPGLITQIAPRRNQLTRPYVSNVDKALIVLSPKKPASDLLLCDRLLVQARAGGIEPVIVVNKADAWEEECDALCKEYGGAARVCRISASEGLGVEALKDIIRGSTVCLAGQSAVGKSTLLNRLAGRPLQETGGLSKKTDRGRHTTRTVEMFPVEELGAFIVDTPGFSILAPPQMDPRDLAGHYPEFEPYASACRFDSCCHGPEPDCAVRRAADEGMIPRGRYDRYLQLVEEVKS